MPGAETGRGLLIGVGLLGLGNVGAGPVEVRPNQRIARVEPGALALLRESRQVMDRMWDDLDPSLRDA